MPRCAAARWAVLCLAAASCCAVSFCVLLCAAVCHAVVCCAVMQCMELLKMYGEVKYFRLMIDRTTGNSRVRRQAGMQPH